MSHEEASTSSDAPCDPEERILPFAPEDDAPGEAEPLPEAQALTIAGDEPDRPYEVLVPAPVAVLPLPTESGVLGYARGELITSVLPSKNPAPANLDELWDPWEGSIAKSLYAPVAIIVSGVILMFWSIAAYSPSYHGILAAACCVVLQLGLRIPLVVLATWAAAYLLEMSLGRVLPAVLKLSAIVVAPLAALCLIIFLAGLAGHTLDDGFIDPLRRGSAGALVAGLISLVMFYALFYALFDLPRDLETCRFILVVWLLQFFVAGMVAHLILHPPPNTPPYVPPTNPFRLSIGN